jgi:hypothetical protein
MRRILRMECLLLAGLILAGLTGCQSGTSSQRRIAAKPEPGLALAGEPGSGGLIERTPPPPPQETFVDRHPLLSKPREYYDSSGNNTLVKVAGATIVGIPVGIFGELRQIVGGQPPTPAARGF